MIASDSEDSSLISMEFDVILDCKEVLSFELLICTGRIGTHFK